MMPGRLKDGGTSLSSFEDLADDVSPAFRLHFFGLPIQAKICIPNNPSNSRIAGILTFICILCIYLIRFFVKVGQNGTFEFAVSIVSPQFFFFRYG